MPLRGERISTSTEATYKVLAIRVAFSDTPIDSSTAYYDRRLLFLNQYWSQVSGGQVTLQSTLWDSVFTLPHTMAYYGDDDRFQERLVFMIRDLVQVADSTVDFRPYQSFLVFHAGQGQEADVLDNSRDQIWSAFITSEDFKEVLGDSTGVGIRTNDLISAGNYFHVKEAVEVPESESQDGYVFGTTGVTCHEFGHQLGLPDLYDTDPNVNGYNQGLGSWDIMGTGVWNANGFVPCEPSAWSKAFLNWIPPLRVETNQSVTLSEVERPIGSNPRLALIPVTQSEYFLLENRQQDPNGNGQFDFDDVNGDGLFDFYTDSYQGAEFDFFLPGSGTGSGLLAYHVDESKIASGLLYNIVEDDRDRKAVDLVEADGIQDLDDPPNGLNGGSPQDVFRAGWKTTWTPTTNPSTEAYPHVRTGISVTNISQADSLMSFDVSFDRLKPGWPVVIGGRARNAGVPPLAVDLDGDGRVELLVPVRRLNNSGALYILEPDGTDFVDVDNDPATRDAFITTTTAIVSTPCVGDVDGDGTPDIVFSTLDGAIYALHLDRTELRDGDQNPATLGIFAFGAGPAPILTDLNGDGSMEIVSGTDANALGGSFVTAFADGGGVFQSYALPMGGSSAAPGAAADLDGDGLPEVVLVNRPRLAGENAATGISIVNWDLFTDPLLSTDPEAYIGFLVHGGGPFSAPVLTDLDRDGTPNIVVADSLGSLHAFRASFASHIPGDYPASYVSLSELAGWPTAALTPGALSEPSLGDLEHDGHPEVFHTGGAGRVAAVHWSGSPRSGFPVAARDPLAPADSTGWWPPLIADVDGDGVLDVIPILPDGRRPAYRADGSAIASFTELGSTGPGAPPILADLDNDGEYEWVETLDQVPLDPRVEIQVRTTSIPVSPGRVAWGQYRLGPTRDGFFPTSPAGGPSGTSILSQVYAYPNPSRSDATFIHYHLTQSARSVRLKILDSAGGTVAEPPTGVADLLGASEHRVSWNHAGLASGIYLCRVEVQSDRGGKEVAFTKLAVIR